MLNAKIKVLAESNPRREGTKAHEKFELYRSGILVSTYIKRGVEAGFPKARMMSMVRKDSKNGHILLNVPA